MCTQVLIYKDPPESISTIGELKARFPTEPEDLWPGVDSDEYCLCGVDIEAVLNRAGVNWKQDDLGDYVINDQERL